MKLLLILLSLILLFPVIHHFILRRKLRRKQVNESSTLYNSLSHIFVLAIILSQWVMLPVYLLQQLAIGFLVFSFCYSVCKISQWRILSTIMSGLMLASNVFLLTMSILFA